MIKTVIVGSVLFLAVDGCEAISQAQKVQTLVSEANQKRIEAETKLAEAQIKLQEAQIQLQAERNAIRRLYSE